VTGSCVEGRGGWCCSSEDERAYEPETRLRVTVFESGVPARLAAACESGLTISPIDARGAAGGGCDVRVLDRREEPLTFFAFLLMSLLSLLMTSTKALLIEAKLRECLMEVLVAGFDFAGVSTAV